MEHYYGSLFKSSFEKQIPKKLKYKKGFEVLKVHEMFKYACIILLFLFRGEKCKRRVTLGISPTIYGKKKIVSKNWKIWMIQKSFTLAI